MSADLATIIVDRLVNVACDRARAEERETAYRHEVASLQGKIHTARDETAVAVAANKKLGAINSDLTAQRDAAQKRVDAIFSALMNLKNASSDFLSRVEMHPRSPKNETCNEADELRIQIVIAKKIWDGEMPF